MSTSTKPKVILAYSGGLDTSVILKWLSEKGFEVICFCADVGQQHEDFEAVKLKATNTGATKCIVTDLRSEFVSNYIFEALKCNAIYEGRYLLGTSVARPCIAKEMVRIAKEEGAMFVAHGATGKGNDQVRFEMCAQALDSKIKTIAPWRDAEFIESFKGRSDLLAYCTKHGIPVDAKPKSNYSIDENLFHTSYESGVLEDADATYEESMFKMSVSPQAAPETSTNIEIEFVEGIPVKLTNTTTGDVKVSIVRFFLVDHIITFVSPLPLCPLIISPFPSLPSIPMSLSPPSTDFFHRLIHSNYSCTPMILPVPTVLVVLTLSRIVSSVSSHGVYMKHPVVHSSAPHIWTSRAYVWTVKSSVLLNTWQMNLHVCVTMDFGLHQKWT